MKYELHLGDCLEVLRGMPTNSVDSIVTDPPYGLSFMGKKWDYDVPSTEIWAECLRVLKPGGHLLSFAAARTYHHMAVGIEMAGFEIRDQIMWVFGSGFPKSHNLKGEHDGKGTALKPAHEPICMARKPITGTVLQNVDEWGTGAINIDACRIHGADAQVTEYTQKRMAPGHQVNDTGAWKQDAQFTGTLKAGRWPANLIHDGSAEVVVMFPAEAGAASRVKGTEASAASVGQITGQRDRVVGAFHGDSGSAARFFYCAKTSRADRHEGLVNPGAQFKQGTTLRKVETTDTKGNNHPTVKPTDLMAYLCRLVTPAGGVVLDPFMGSGSTGKAAMREGLQFIGCELDQSYMAIAEARILYAQQFAKDESSQTSLF